MARPFKIRLGIVAGVEFAPECFAFVCFRTQVNSNASDTHDADARG